MITAKIGEDSRNNNGEYIEVDDQGNITAHSWKDGETVITEYSLDDDECKELILILSLYVEQEKRRLE